MKRLTLAAVAALCLISFAEVPLMTPEQLKEQASHIVIGKVVAVYSYDEGSGDHVTTRSIVEVAVEGTEKGEGLAAGEVVYVKVWQAKKRPAGWAGASGHSVPAVGDAVRAHVTRGKDGSLSALLPNGIGPQK
ncbi:MAG: hypothetical protein HUU15_12280 [Candidatus Brocadiae bacterium]|nr:hypothetical protein [Candidatus Brocadiia bacterium]